MCQTVVRTCRGTGVREYGRRVCAVPTTLTSAHEAPFGGRPMDETEATTDSPLSVAREIIELRAVKEGCGPGEYDAEHDPKGHILSLLNALHQWSHRHGFDWNSQLALAQGFFEQDITKSQPGAGALPAPQIKDLRCPKCGQATCFVIEVSECLLMFSDGTVLHGDGGEEWDDSSYCRCHACDHMGTGYQFRKTSQDQEEARAHGQPI